MSTLYLCILTSRVGITNETTTANLTSPSTHVTFLLTGPLDDFLLYSRQEHSKWLIDIAHDICDPTLKRGLLHVWDAPEGTLKSVNPTDPLMASIYLYHVQNVVSLSKISKREGKSKTVAALSPNASVMAHRVKQRDGECWVSGIGDPLVNSHLCPKRTGDHLLRVIYRTFVSSQVPADLSIYNEICGISLSAILDKWFDAYELGLRFVATTNNYECHSFLPPDYPQHMKRTIYGSFNSPLAPLHPLLHGHPTGPPDPQKPNNPPPGLIRWHYLQCVIRKFAHPDYLNLQNIYYYETPGLRMEGDSDDEGTDSDFEWPSAILDRGRAMRADIEDQEERQRFVAEWIAATTWQEGLAE